MPPKKQGKASVATKTTTKASTNKRKADDQGDDDDAAVPEKKVKLHKLLKGLADEKGNLPVLEGQRAVRGRRQQAPTRRAPPQATITEDGSEEHEDDAAPEPETQPGGTRGRSHDPTGPANEDDNATAQDRSKSRDKGKGRQRDQAPELQGGAVNGLPIRTSPGRQGSNGTGKHQSKSSQALPGAGTGPFHDTRSSAFGKKRTSAGSTDRPKREISGVDRPRSSLPDDNNAGQVSGSPNSGQNGNETQEVRNLDPAVEADRKRSVYTNAWQDIWRKLGGLQVLDATFHRYRWLHMRSNFCADNGHFADLGVWADDEDANTYLLDIQKAVELALLAYYAPLWQEWIEEAQIDFGQAAVDVWDQKFQQVADAIANGTGIAREPEWQDKYQAEWAGLQERFRGIADDRIRLRFEEAHGRAQDIRTNYNFWLRPLKNMDGPEYRSMTDYCDQLHDHLTEQLIEDVLRRDWPPAPWDGPMLARINRMKTRVKQGFPPYPYPAAFPSPKTASFPEVAQKIGFDHERSRQEPGRWQQMGPLGSGGFGSVGVWARYDKYGRVVDRFALKDSYMARMNGNETEDSWNNESYWHGDIEDRLPKEYFAMEMLNQNPDSENIVQCKAYGVYDEKRMYRLYLEYCPHADLETTINAYLRFAAIDREAGDPEIQIPNRAMWCIFQALAAALCLMDRGFIPNAISGLVNALPGFQQMLHRDLKPANVFLGLPKDNGTWPKIPVSKVGDFGGVKFTNEADATTSQFGTNGYFPPESLNFGVTHPIRPWSDIWAVGRIMLSLINSSHQDDHAMIPAWPNFTDLPPLKEGAEVGYDQRLRDLVMNCLAPVPAARPSATDLLRGIQIEVAPTTESPGAPPSISVQVASDEEILMFVTDRYLPFATA